MLQPGHVGINRARRMTIDDTVDQEVLVLSKLSIAAPPVRIRLWLRWRCVFGRNDEKCRIDEQARKKTRRSCSQQWSWVHPLWLDSGATWILCPNSYTRKSSPIWLICLIKHFWLIPTRRHISENRSAIENNGSREVLYSNEVKPGGSTILSKL